MKKNNSVVIKLAAIVVICSLLSACSFSEVFSKLKDVSIFEKSEKTEMDYSSTDGVLVSSVVEGSPAEASGIERGDIILEINGEQVHSLQDIRDVLVGFKAGDKVEMKVLHGDKIKSLELVFAEDVSLGVYVNETKQENFSSGWTPEGGGSSFALILDVIKNSPAEKAGLGRGDMILALDGETLSADNGLVDLLEAYEPGDKVTLEVFSTASQETKNIDVILGEHPDDAEKAYLGINYQDFTGMGTLPHEQGLPFSNFPGLDEENQPDAELPDLQNDLFDEDFNLPEGDLVKSLLVKEVVTGSPADEAGLQQDDIILALNSEEISTQENFAQAIQALSPGDSVTLTISREDIDQPFDIEVILGENPTEEGAGYLGIKVGVFINMEYSLNNGPIFIDFLPFNIPTRIGL